MYYSKRASSLISSVSDKPNIECNISMDISMDFQYQQPAVANFFFLLCSYLQICKVATGREVIPITIPPICLDDSFRDHDQSNPFAALFNHENRLIPILSLVINLVVNHAKCQYQAAMPGRHGVSKCSFYIRHNQYGTWNTCICGREILFRRSLLYINRYWCLKFYLTNALM